MATRRPDIESDPGAIRPIPTTYNGIEFRSKLESNVARLFDACEMPWAYEQEGFDLGGVWYLPDFWLPTVRQFVEVKGVADDPSVDKCALLADQLRPPTSPLGGTLAVVVLSVPFIRLHLGVANEVFGFGFAGGDYGDAPLDALLVSCETCGARYFMTETGAWNCTACGEHSKNYYRQVLVRASHRRGETRYALL